MNETEVESITDDLVDEVATIATKTQNAPIIEDVAWLVVGGA